MKDLTIGGRGSGNGKFMTIAEVAEALNVTEKTVRNTIARLNAKNAHLERPFQMLGKTTMQGSHGGVPKIYLAEWEVGLITEEIKVSRSSGLAKIPKAKQPITKFEENQKIIEVVEILQSRAEAYMEEIQALQKDVVQKTNELTDAFQSAGSFSLRDAAKFFDMRPKKEFIPFLLEKDYLFQDQKSRRCHARIEYSTAGGNFATAYFELRLVDRGGKPRKQTIVTALGMRHLSDVLAHKKKRTIQRLPL